MAKILLTGPAGSGKTHRVLDEFIGNIQSPGGAFHCDSYFILPSAEHSERIVSLILQRGVPGFFHRRVTTLSRLIQDLFELHDENVISSTTRFLLIRDIMQSRPWDYFEDIQNTPGFLDLIAHFLSELRESRIMPDSFRGRMNELKKIEPMLAPKYEALAGIYESYEERLQAEGLRERQDLLTLFREKKARGFRMRRFKKLWLDGFFDFTAVQAEYLRELCEASDEVTVTLTKDPASRREALFDIPARTERLLGTLGFETVLMPGPSKRSARPALTYLENRLFDEEETKTKPPAAEDTVRIFEAVGVQGEVEMIAREIEKLYRGGKYRFSDFAVLLRLIGPYESVIRSVFGRYGIPFEMHERERLRLAPMIHTVVLLVKIFRGGWKREDLFNFLKSGYVRRLGTGAKQMEWVNELEHAAMREGILKGRENWLRDWGLGFPEDKREELNKRKAELLEPFVQFEEKLSKAANFTALRKFFETAVEETFEIFRVEENIQTEEALNESVRRDGASARRLESILDEMRVHLTLKGRSEMTFEEFADQFLRLVDLDLYSLHHQDRNRVQIYDVSLARQKEYKVVFTAGMLEKSFPMHIKEDPILSDWERRLFNEGRETGLSERLPRQNLERYLFYIAVTRASEHLILSCPRLNLEGKESLPSFYLDEVLSLFPGMKPKKQDLAHPYPSPEDAVSLRELEISALGQLWQTERFTEDEEPLLAALFNQMLAAPEAQKKFRFAFPRIEAKLQSEALRAGDYFRTRETSPTRLEEYAKCPYKYFANRVLKLKDPEEEINFRIKGTVMHKVLEDFFRLRASGRKDILQWDKVKQFVLKELDKGLAAAPLFFEKKYQADLDRDEIEEMLLRFLKAELERLETSGFSPRYFEFSFGSKENDDAHPLEVGEGDARTLVTGKIDRVDVDSSGQYALVLDYKRSAKFKRDDMEMGTALQLPIYISAVERFLNLKPVGAQLYSLMECKPGGFYHKENAGGFNDFPPRALMLTDSEFRAVLARSMDYISRFVQGMRNLEIPVKPRALNACDNCSFTPVCRIEKWRLPLILQEVKKEDAERAKEQNKEQNFEIRSANLETNSKSE